jgi:fimbrial chaperone protein
MKKLLITLLFSLYATQLLAWGITPMGLTIEPGQRAATLKIDNKKGDKILAVRLKATTRVQDEYGQDILVDTKDLLIFPKQVIVPAKKSLSVRVAVRKANNTKFEKAYRFIAEEVAISEEVKAKSGVEVKVLLKYIGSIYLSTKADKVENFSIQSATLSAKGLHLQVSNQGSAHKIFRPENIKALISDKKIAVNSKQQVYNVLSQQAFELLIPLESAALSTLRSANQVTLANGCKTCTDDEIYTLNLQ